MVYKISFQEMDRLAKEKLSEQSPTTLEDKRRQYLELKKQRSSNIPPQEDLQFLKAFRDDIRKNHRKEGYCNPFEGDENSTPSVSGYWKKNDRITNFCVRIGQRNLAFLCIKGRDEEYQGEMLDSNFLTDSDSEINLFAIGLQEVFFLNQ